MVSNGFSGIFYGILKCLLDEKLVQVPNLLPGSDGGPLHSVSTAYQ